MNNIRSFDRYAFIFGHPDDEMYAATLIKSLTDANKHVALVYVTSGNRQGDDVGLLREEEAAKVAKLLGIPSDKLYLLHITEHEVKLNLKKILTEIEQALRANKIECVITHDHEGGHSVHDFTSFCGYRCARTVGADLWTFPAYYGQPHERVTNTFIPPRHADAVIELDSDQAALKTKLINTHVTQQKYFENLPKEAMDRLLKRELFRHIAGEVDYTVAPTSPVGFDFDGSPTRLADFLDAIGKVDA